MFPKLFLFHSLSDIHSSLGNEYVPYNKFIPQALTRIDTKLTNDKNTYPDSIVSYTDTWASTPTKYVPNTEKYDIEHIIMPTQHGLPDPILSQSDIIKVHQQKVNTLAELEREICQKQKNSTNIHDIYNSNKPGVGEIEVSHNRYCIL